MQHIWAIQKVRYAFILFSLIFYAFTNLNPVYSFEKSRLIKFKNYLYERKEAGKKISFPVYKLTKKRFSFSAVLPKLSQKSIMIENVFYQKYEIPGGKLIGDVGKPGIPGFVRMILVPEGAQVKVKVTKEKAQIIRDTLIYPIQPMFREKFNTINSNTLHKSLQHENLYIDDEFYQKDHFYPERLYEISYDIIRGCRVAILNVQSAQYNPYRREMIYYPDLKIDIFFKGGKTNYIPINKRSIFLENMYRQIFFNYDAIAIKKSELLAKIPLIQRIDLLIITPTIFELQANQLAEWKTEKGFTTKVATLDDIYREEGGTSAEHIKAYIENIYMRFNLSYVILLGDAEIIPPHYETRDSWSGDMIGTDHYYAEMDGEGIFPDLVIGRISLDDMASSFTTLDPIEVAQTVIDKIISYEKNPPNVKDFYGRILHVSYFQDNFVYPFASYFESDGRGEKRYVQTIEEIRNFFLSEGYPFLPRQYKQDQTYWPEGHLGPQLFSDGTPLPADLLWPEFQWDGNAEGISEEINKGCFLVLYRGHGTHNGWTAPRFTSINFDMLHNSNLTPVTLSFTCLSGWFDNETCDAGHCSNPDNESFAEKFLRMEGGSVAIVAATRETNPDANETMIKGFIDRIWPAMLPRFPVNEDLDGVHIPSSKRLGDALNYAKFYTGSILTDEIKIRESLEKYHLFGDPTMEIWTAYPYFEKPSLIDPNVLQPLIPLRRTYWIPIKIDDVLVSIIQNGQIISQGISEKGRVRLDLKEPILGKIKTSISLNKTGYTTQTYPIYFSRIYNFSKDIRGKQNWNINR